jgi:hypothetical protein
MSPAKIEYRLWLFENMQRSATTTGETSTSARFARRKGMCVEKARICQIKAQSPKVPRAFHRILRSLSVFIYTLLSLHEMECSGSYVHGKGLAKQGWGRPYGTLLLQEASFKHATILEGERHVRENTVERQA